MAIGLDSMSREELIGLVKQFQESNTSWKTRALEAEALVRAAPNALRDAKTHLDQNIREGVNCPCCGQFVKLYRRPINSSMAWTLVLIYRYYKDRLLDEWLHVETYMKGLPGIPASLVGGDFSKLRYWGILEAKYDTPETLDDPDTRRAGYYRITQKGIDFVLGKITVPRHVYLFNREVHGFSPELISIEDAFKDRYDYRRLMADGDIPPFPVVMPRIA